MLSIKPESYLIFLVELRVDQCELLNPVADDAPRSCRHLKNKPGVFRGTLHNPINPRHNPVVPFSLVWLILHASDVKDNAGAADAGA